MPPKRKNFFDFSAKEVSKKETPLTEFNFCQGRIKHFIRDTTLIRSPLQAARSAGYKHIPGN
jgi:hypothetical protein